DPRDLILCVQDRLDSFLRQEQRFKHLLFRNDPPTAFNHDDRVTTSRDEEVNVTGKKLALQRVHRQGAAQATDAHAGNGAAEGDVRNLERGRRADQGYRIGVVFAVDGKHRGDHLRLTEKSFGEQRPQGTIDQARNEDLALRRPPLALEETAGNFARGEGTLLVVNCQGEEVYPLTRGAGPHHRHEHHGLAVGDDRGATGLFG